MRRSYIASFLIVVFLACVGAQYVMLVMESVPEPDMLYRQGPRRPQNLLVPTANNAVPGKVTMQDIEDGKARLVGALGEPLGSWLLVEGEMVGQDAKNKGGPVMFRVFRMNGRWLSTPKPVELFEGAKMQGPMASVGNMEIGKFYRLVGFEHAGVETPDWTHDGYDNEPVTKHGLVWVSYVPVTCEPIARLSETLEKSVGQFVTLVGPAKSEKGTAFVMDENQMVQVDASDPWPKEWEGKEVQVQGTVSKEADSKYYSIDPKIKELVSLEGQVGKPVRLRGLLWVGQQTVFLYRGTPVYLSGEWTPQLHGQKVVIEGQLEQVAAKEMPNVAMFGQKMEKLYKLTAVKITQASAADR
jgi:hypothetical protein